ncbi:uncharacterized protein LOC144577747 isoform X2 [Callithrix jacchus]
MAGKQEGRSVAAAGFAATTKRAPSGLLGSLALTRTPTYGTTSGPRADPGPHLRNSFRSPRCPGLKSAPQPRGWGKGREARLRPARPHLPSAPERSAWGWIPCLPFPRQLLAPVTRAGSPNRQEGVPRCLQLQDVGEQKQKLSLPDKQDQKTRTKSLCGQGMG